MAVALAPWLFGAAEPWAWLAISLWVQMAAGLRLIGILREGYISAIVGKASLWCALVLLTAAVQITPLPAALARALNPLGTEIQSTAANILAAAEPPSRITTPAPHELTPSTRLSVAPAETKRALHLLVLCALTLLALLSSVSDREEVETVALVLALDGLAMACFAVVQELSGTRFIYGVFRPRLGGTFFGPFINRNHFATWMNLATGAVLALLLSATRHALSPRHLPWRDRLALLSSRRVNVIVMLSYSLLLMVVSTLFSLSRGGWVSLFFSGALTLAWYRIHRRHGRFALPLSILVTVLIGVVAWIGWHPLVERLDAWAASADPLYSTRMRMTLATLKMWSSAPLTGWGYGAFQHAFPLFQSLELQVGRFVYAHNDFAQLAAEAGLLGVTAFGAGILAFVVGLRRGYRKAAEEARLFIIGLGFSLCATALHSTVDFGLRRPANALLLMTVASLALATTRLPGYGRSYMYEIGISGLRVRLVAILLLAGLIRLGTYTWREWQAELAFARFLQWQTLSDTASTSAARVEAVEMMLDEVSNLQSARIENPEIHFESGIAMLKAAAQKDLPAETRIAMAHHAEWFARSATALAPSDYEYWLWFSRALQVNGKPLPARIAAGRAQDLAPPGIVLPP